MSHFTVTVVLPRQPENESDLNDMLSTLVAPFDENERVEPYKAYVTPVNENWRDMPDRDLGWPWSYIKSEVGKDVDLSDNNAVAKWLNDKWGVSEEQYHVDETGLYQMSSYNPNSKWDWWQVGGRWTGFYKLRDGATGLTGSPGLGTGSPEAGLADAARKGDIDTEGQRVQTYAVLAEGVWKAPGNMGWFGMSSETDTEAISFDVWFQEHFWDTMPDDAWLAVLDMHI